jgi:hypothetical protein
MNAPDHDDAKLLELLNRQPTSLRPCFTDSPFEGVTYSRATCMPRRHIHLSRLAHPHLQGSPLGADMRDARALLAEPHYA